MNKEQTQEILKIAKVLEENDAQTLIGLVSDFALKNWSLTEQSALNFLEITKLCKRLANRELYRCVRADWSFETIKKLKQNLSQSLPCAFPLMPVCTFGIFVWLKINYFTSTHFQYATRA